MAVSASWSSSASASEAPPRTARVTSPMRARRCGSCSPDCASSSPRISGTLLPSSAPSTLAQRAVSASTSHGPTTGQRDSVSSDCARNSGLRNAQLAAATTAPTISSSSQKCSRVQVPNASTTHASNGRSLACCNSEANFGTTKMNMIATAAMPATTSTAG